MSRFRFAMLMLLIGAVLAWTASKTDSIRRTVVGDTSTWTHSSLAAALGGVAAFIVFSAEALTLTVKMRPYRWFAFVLLVPGTLMALIAFGEATDHVIINANALVLPKVGLTPKYETIPFASIAWASIDRRKEFITFVKRDRSKVRIPMGDLVRESLPDLQAALEKHDIDLF